MEKRLMGTRKHFVILIFSIVFASLSLILSLGYCWTGLAVTYNWPVWNEYLFAGPRILYNLYSVGIALFFIIIAFCVKTRPKRILLVASLMLIPGILIFIHFFILAFAFGRM